MITEDYCSAKVAKLLQEKGFTEPVTELNRLLFKEGETKPTDKVEPTDYNSIDPHFSKPIDKVEPMFNIGDTIVEKDLDECGYGTIKDIKDGQYIFTDGSGMNINEQNGWQLVKTSTNIKQKPAWNEGEPWFPTGVLESPLKTFPRVNEFEVGSSYRR